MSSLQNATQQHFPILCADNKFEIRNARNCSNFWRVFFIVARTNLKSLLGCKLFPWKWIWQRKKKNRIKTYILSRTACRPIFHSTRAPPSWQLKTAYWFTAVCSQVMSTIVPCWDTSVVSSVKLLLWLSYCQTCRSPENVPPASWSLLNGFVVRTWIHDLMAGSVWCSS